MSLDVAYYVAYFAMILVLFLAAIRRGRGQSWKALCVVAGVLFVGAGVLLFARY